jgi:hypothetical protein
VGYLLIVTVDFTFAFYHLIKKGGKILAEKKKVNWFEQIERK